MAEDFASIHPWNLAELARHLHSIGVGLEYDPQEHLREWKALQERRRAEPVAACRPAHGGMSASLQDKIGSDTHLGAAS